MPFSHGEWYLILAILFGVLGTISMKLSLGLKRLKPSICLFIFYLISFISLTLSLQSMDISIIYAIWSGVGTVLVAIIGIFMFDESVSLRKILSICLIVIGVIGIHLTDAVK